jgi:hypothetical protein
MLLENDAPTVESGSGDSATAVQGEPNAGKRRGRRPSHAEHWTKVTVVLMDRQIIFLDRLVADIRAANGASISRANLIRALVDALAQSDIDLTSSRSEKDLRQVLAARLHRDKVAS